MVRQTIHVEDALERGQEVVGKAIELAQSVYEEVQEKMEDSIAPPEPAWYEKLWEWKGVIIIGAVAGWWYFKGRKHTKQSEEAGSSFFKRPKEHVELKLVGSNLSKKDIISPSDGFVVISIQKEGSKEWKVLKETEVIVDNDSPSWKPLVVSTKGVKLFRFEVFDGDKAKEDLKAKRTTLGAAEATLEQVVAGVELGLLKKGKLHVQGQMK